MLCIYDCRLCRFASQVELPQPNIHPPSWYIMKGLLHASMRDVARAERHVCVNDCHCFGFLPKTEWRRAHTDPTLGRCPKCKTSRFEVVEGRNGKFLRPRKKFWYFGLGEIIRCADNYSMYAS